MVLIWRGKGLWVLRSLAAVMGLFIGVFVVQKELGYPLMDAIQQRIGMAAFAGWLLIVLSGLPLLGLAVRAYRDGPRRYFEPESGRVLLRRAEHSLYFINVWWYGLAACAAGVALLRV